MNSSKQSFMRGAMVLTTASIVTKVLDMIIQVVVARELGSAAFGLFRTVNPIFFLLFTIATLALPPALSKVIAENLIVDNTAKVRRAMRICNAVVLFLSIAICVPAVLCAPYVSARWLDPRATLPFLAAVLRIPVLGLYSVLSGYYMGVQNQTPPAIAWIVETVVRTVVTIPLVLFMNHFGIAYGALAVMVGMGVGEIAGYLYLRWNYLRHDAKWLSNPTAVSTTRQSTRGTIRDLAEVALPSTFRNLFGIFAYAAEPVVVYLAFSRVGVAKTAATNLYGSFGMAIQLLLIPTVLTSSLSSVVIPAVSEAAAIRNHRLVSYRLTQVVQMTFMVALPATVFFMLSGADLATTLYNDPLAGALLAYLAPMCIFVYLEEPLFALLQGLNKATVSVGISIFTSAIRMFAIYYFVRVGHDGAFGIAKAAAVANITSLLLLLLAVRRYVTYSVRASDLVKMLLATGISAWPIYQIHASLPQSLTMVHVIASMGVGCIVYTIALVYLGVLPTRLLQRIPWVGHVAAGLLNRMPFLK